MLCLSVCFRNAKLHRGHIKRDHPRRQGSGSHLCRRRPIHLQGKTARNSFVVHAYTRTCTIRFQPEISVIAHVLSNFYRFRLARNVENFPFKRKAHPWRSSSEWRKVVLGPETRVFRLLLIRALHIYPTSVSADYRSSVYHQVFKACVTATYNIPKSKSASRKSLRLCFPIHILFSVFLRKVYNFQGNKI